jgi:hypothetical protein
LDFLLEYYYYALLLELRVVNGALSSRFSSKSGRYPPICVAATERGRERERENKALVSVREREREEEEEEEASRERERERERDDDDDRRETTIAKNSRLQSRTLPRR